MAVALDFRLFASDATGVTETSFAIACAILCAFLGVVLRHLGRRRLYESASKFEGPPTLPLIGNAHLFIGNSEDHLKAIKKIANSYPAPFRFWMGHLLHIGITDPEHIKTVLTSPKTLAKGYVYRCIEAATGPSLVAAPVPEWRVRRKTVQQTFNAKILNSFLKVFDLQAKVLAGRMGRRSDGPEFEIIELFGLALLDMFCETMMDVEIEAPEDSKSSYLCGVWNGGATVTQRVFAFWLYPDFLFKHSQLGKDQRQARKIIHDFTKNGIRQKKRELLKRGDPGKPRDGEDDEFEPRTRAIDVFLDHLLKLSSSGGSNVYDSDEELRDEVAAMMIAAFDTTATTLSFAVLMLASHPEVQEKVYQEVFGIFGDDDREVTHEDLGRMNYLERSLKETMRLFPAFPAITRLVTDDLDIGGHTLSKGSEVLIPVLEIHRNEKYWPDPMKFDPDRFLPEEVAERHPYSYLAFSGGPRNCIGQRYAMMAMKTVMAIILRKYILKKYNIVSVKDIRLKIELSLKPVDPIAIRVERRLRI